MIEGIHYNDSIVLSDNVFKIETAHRVATAIIFISSILLLISSLKNFTDENKIYNVLGLIGLLGSSIGIISEVLNIRLIKINTKKGKKLYLFNNFILIVTLFVDIILSFYK